MRRPITVFDYPVVIKQQLGFLTISVPDFGVTVVEQLPKALNKEFLAKLGLAVGKAWIRANSEMLKKGDHGTLPKPSPTKEVLKGKTSRGYTVPQVAKILKLSQMTIRRMADSGALACEVTAGGHRRFSEGVVESYKSQIAE